MKLMMTRVSSAVDIVVSLSLSLSFGGDLRFRRAGSKYSRTGQESLKHFEWPYLYFGLEYDAGGNAL
jgi:hypothetical protein